MPLPAVPNLTLIAKRLLLIFPEGTEHRNYVIRDLAARTVFVMFYVGAVEGANRWLRPSQITDMSDDQAFKLSDADRESWAAYSLQAKKQRPTAPWYASNSREPIRDETLRTGFIPARAVIERTGIPTTSAAPRYALERQFAALFDSALGGKELLDAIEAWRESHLSRAALARQLLVKASAVTAKDAVSVLFPNGEQRQLAPGPSSVIAKAVIEVFAPLYLKKPAVLWLSESGNKVVARDEALATAMGFKIDPSKALPDVILVDLGEEHSGAEMLVVFCEIVATDGPISHQRKIALTTLALEAGFGERSLAFLTAFMDRGSPPFKKAASELAWNSYVWFASEPENIIELRGGKPARSLTQLP